MKLNPHQLEYIQAELGTLERIVNYNTAKANNNNQYYLRRMEVLRLFLHLDRLQQNQTLERKDYGYEFT